MILLIAGKELHVLILIPDNILVERPWRTVKYEEVYLKEYRSMP